LTPGQRLQQKALVLGSLLVGMAVPAAQAQRIFPQQTGWTITNSSGRGSVTSQTARSRASAAFPEVLVDPGTELLIGPDGNYRYRITDPTIKFGSFYQNRTIDESETSSFNAITILNDSSYSVFKN
jgi:hypothetical protein